MICTDWYISPQMQILTVTVQLSSKAHQVYLLTCDYDGGINYSEIVLQHCSTFTVRI